MAAQGGKAVFVGPFSLEVFGTQRLSRQVAESLMLRIHHAYLQAVLAQALRLF